MRITDDMRRCVVFFGYADATPGKGGIHCIGTGFLLDHDGLGYLVTAQHLAHQTGQDPFLLRINKSDGSSDNEHVDGAEWIMHPDPTVDLAATPILLSPQFGHDVIYLGGETLELTQDDFKKENIGIGDFTYTVGLFQLMSGEKRNLPVCHFGSISLFPGEEKVPVIDWRDPTEKNVIMTEGFLIESQSLSGLSGSPVFTRSDVMFDPSNINITAPLNRRYDSRKVLWPRVQLRLLGLWQGSWVLPPDEARAAQSRSSGAARVPLGMGVVVPCYKIIELLDQPDVKKSRDEIIAAHSPNAVNLDSVRESSVTQGAYDSEKLETEPLTIQSALLCDGLEVEMNGGKSLIGMYGEIVFYRRIPEKDSCTLFLKFRGKPGLRRLAFRVVDSEKNLLREPFESLIRVDEHTQKADASVDKVTYKLPQKPDTITFQIKQGEKEWEDLVSYDTRVIPEL